MPILVDGPDVVSTTKVTKQTQKLAQSCQGSSLGSPFQSATLPPIRNCGEFGCKGHGGTDFAVPVGTPLVAAADGVIQILKVDSRSLPQPDPRSGLLVKGYGLYVVLRHTDGSATLYGHLSATEPGLRIGSSVTKGQLIARSGGARGDSNSGGSTGPHLHFEYAPNGRIFVKTSKIDPVPCISTTATGSITVSDNGSLADDAFSLFIDGILIGSTTIGGLNNFAVNGLIPGIHTLSLEVIIAPDDAGTYLITLADGLTFTDGSTSRVGSPPQGTIVTESIRVP
eukprot:c14129_g1_i1.p1 GENE.c14129_g1_i1~~c14129_g1_i1.p1  ORF type:complete len:283 (+),score=40.02 c14129_g1_i1:874-1722(+)